MKLQLTALTLLVLLAQTTHAMNDAPDLRNAAGDGNVKRVQGLLAQGVNVNSKNIFGWTPLYEAVRNGCTGVVKLLLKAPKIAVNSKDITGGTPLYWAAWEGHAEVLQLPLRAPGIEVDSKDINVWTPLCVAAHKGRLAAVQALIEYGEQQD